MPNNKETNKFEVVQTRNTIFEQLTLHTIKETVNV